ncbi:MAG: carboxylating nicotinate-nucleotide diphosphorylase [SAR324 cluster bacterium]|nr:carboxylating nicotinate-nucleotide diphosphorylase [SAR324 cluster bacterium]
MHQLYVRRLIQTALEEDISWQDFSTQSTIDPSWTGSFVIHQKKPGVVSGLDIARDTFLMLDPDAHWIAFQKDGNWNPPGTLLASVSGNACALLQAERVALNFLQRLSGIATLTWNYVQEARKGSPTVHIVDTRKTTPGLRYLEKYAIRSGGGHNHRFNLSDAVMLKDNHLAMLKQHGVPLKDAILKARASIPHTMRIEVEVDLLSQIDDALAGGADIILLDNMSCEELKQAVQKIQKRAITEASGGVSLQTVADIAATGVDQISVGALTHSALALDISLDYEDEPSH